MMKQYTVKEWEKLTPDQRAALIPKATETISDHPDMGWSCHGCSRNSSDYPGVPSQVSWDLHKCNTLW
jgi:hypothetical protein